MIRPATPEDTAAIAEVTRAAFAGKLKALRIVAEIEPEISLVAEEDGSIVGHTMLSRMRMGDERPLQLSPLSVAPSQKRRGIGSALVVEALRLADAAGERVVLLLGHPDYYRRFGFEPATPYGILAPHDYGPAWMVARLSAWEPSFRGQVTFPPAFDD